jgi:hypothetical protein
MRALEQSILCPQGPLYCIAHRLSQTARSFPLSAHLPEGHGCGADERAVGTRWLGIMNAEGQYVPADSPRLLETAVVGRADACWGVRAQRSDHLWRLLCSRVARAVKRRALGKLQADDPGCGIWVARTEFLRPVTAGEREPTSQLHGHLAELIAAQGGRVVQQPIGPRPRAGGRAKYGMLNRLAPGSRSLEQARRLVQQFRGAASR